MEKLQEVVCAYITFKYEDGHDAALEFSDPGYMSSVKSLLRREESEEKIYGKKPTFTQAEEPTNVLWENQSIKGYNFIGRAIRGSFFIIILLLVTFGILIYLLRQKV